MDRGIEWDIMWSLDELKSSYFDSVTRASPPARCDKQNLQANPKPSSEPVASVVFSRTLSDSSSLDSVGRLSNFEVFLVRGNPLEPSADELPVVTSAKSSDGTNVTLSIESVAYLGARSAHTFQVYFPRESIHGVLPAREICGDEKSMGLGESVERIVLIPFSNIETGSYVCEIQFKVTYQCQQPRSYEGIIKSRVIKQAGLSDLLKNENAAIPPGPGLSVENLRMAQSTTKSSRNEYEKFDSDRILYHIREVLDKAKSNEQTESARTHIQKTFDREEKHAERTSKLQTHQGVLTEPQTDKDQPRLSFVDPVSPVVASIPVSKAVSMSQTESQTSDSGVSSTNRSQLSSVSSYIPAPVVTDTSPRRLRGLANLMAFSGDTIINET